MFEIQLSQGAINVINIVLALIVGLAVRDLANSFVSGLLFYLSSDFKPGDLVYIDGERALIISIGIRQTIFNIEKEEGTSWRYVPNDRIKFARLEKIVDNMVDQEIEDIKRKLSSLEKELPK